VPIAISFNSKQTDVISVEIKPIQNGWVVSSKEQLSIGICRNQPGS
jgi:hypothetical protein